MPVVQYRTILHYRHRGIREANLTISGQEVFKKPQPVSNMEREHHSPRRPFPFHQTPRRLNLNHRESMLRIASSSEAMLFRSRISPLAINSGTVCKGTPTTAIFSSLSGGRLDGIRSVAR